MPPHWSLVFTFCCWTAIVTGGHACLTGHAQDQLPPSVINDSGARLQQGQTSSAFLPESPAFQLPVTAVEMHSVHTTVNEAETAPHSAFSSLKFYVPELSRTFRSMDWAEQATALATYYKGLEPPSWFLWGAVYGEAVTELWSSPSPTLISAPQENGEAAHIEEEKLQPKIHESTPEASSPDRDCGSHEQAEQPTLWDPYADAHLAMLHGFVRHQAWATWLTLYGAAVTGHAAKAGGFKDQSLSSSDWQQYVIPSIQLPSTAWCGAAVAVASIALHIWQAIGNHALKRRIQLLEANFVPAQGPARQKCSNSVYNLSADAGLGAASLNPVKKSLRRRLLKWVQTQPQQSQAIVPFGSGINRGLNVSHLGTARRSQPLLLMAAPATGSPEFRGSPGRQMSFVPFCLVKYMDARFAIVLDERSMRRYGSWGTNVKVLPQPTSHHLATHLSSHDTSVGPAFGAIAPNKVSAISHQGPREDCSTDPTEVCSEQEQDLKVEELDNTTDDNNHKTNKSWTEALDEGFAALPMYNCHKARLDIKEHNDPEWMLNAATAELQCLHAEDLCRDGKGFEALRVINKSSKTLCQATRNTICGGLCPLLVTPDCNVQVLKGLSYPSSSATARANALACRGNIHTELAMDKEAVYDLLEAVKADPNSVCLPSLLKHLIMLGQHGAAKRLAELVQSGAFTSGTPRSWTNIINAHMADVALLEELMVSGAKKDVDKGEQTLDKLYGLRDRCSNDILAYLKARQEHCLNRPEDVLETVQPFLAGRTDPRCWALGLAAEAHWLMGDVSQVITCLWELQSTELTTADDMVGYKKPAFPVLRKRLQEFEDLEIQWGQVYWLQQLSSTEPLPGQWEASAVNLRKLRVLSSTVKYSPRMAARELLLWGKQYLHDALEADRQGDPIAAQHHVLCLNACEQAVALMPGSQKVFLEARNIQRQSLQSLQAKHELACMATEVLKRVDISSPESVMWAGVQQWAEARNKFSDDWDRQWHSGCNWAHLLGLQWDVRDPNVIVRAKRNLMFKCMPDRAHTAHCFLNFRADPVLEGVGSACGAFEQASVALVTCSWVSSLLDKAAQILTDPVDRLAAHYSLILDLSMDPATCPAAYAGMGWVQCEDEKACLRNWLIQEQSAPEAAARLQQRIAEEQETERFQREAIAKMEGQCNQQSSQEDVDMEDGSSYATDEESTNDSCGAFDEDDRQHASDQHGGRMDTGEYDMEVDSSTDSPTEEDDSSNEGCSRNNGGAGASSSDNSQQDSGAHAYPDFGQDADSAADQQGNPGCEAQDGYVPADTAHYQDHNKDEEDALLHECFQPMDDM